MNVQAFDNSYRAQFIRFCRSFRTYLDDSFLSDEELEVFRGGAEEPTFLLVDEDCRIQGAASLLWHEHRRRCGQARFRIFYCTTNSFEHYKALWSRVLDWCPAEVERLVLFIPQTNSDLRQTMAALGFTIERYSFLLERTQQQVPEAAWPCGYFIKPFQRHRDEQAWCDVRNTAFSGQGAVDVPITPELVERMIDTEEQLPEGMMILYHGEEPVGIVRTTKEWHKGSFWNYIGMLAIAPEYQGKGLGRLLLRRALQHGDAHGIPNAILTVNAENKQAVDLYLDEGFSIHRVMECWSHFPNNSASTDRVDD